MKTKTKTQTQKVKTKTYYRGNPVIGMKPVIGLVADEGYIEAKRYASSLKAGREESPRLPDTPREVMIQTEEINVDMITRGKP